jgi:hypothetical protein
LLTFASDADIFACCAGISANANDAIQAIKIATFFSIASPLLGFVIFSVVFIPIFGNLYTHIFVADVFVALHAGFAPAKVEYIIRFPPLQIL